MYGAVMCDLVDRAKKCKVKFLTVILSLSRTIDPAYVEVRRQLGDNAQYCNEASYTARLTVTAHFRKMLSLPITCNANFRVIRPMTSAFAR